MTNIMSRDVVEELIRQVTGCKTHKELLTMLEITTPGILNKYEKIRTGDHKLIVAAVDIQFIRLNLPKKQGTAYSPN